MFQLLPALSLATPLSWVLAASTVAIGNVSVDVEHVAMALADDWGGRLGSEGEREVRGEVRRKVRGGGRGVATSVPRASTPDVFSQTLRLCGRPRPGERICFRHHAP